MITPPPVTRLIAVEFGGLAGEMEPWQSERIAPVAEQFGDGRLVALRIALENFSR